LAARALSSVAFLSCRKDAISDELSTVDPREVAGFGLEELIEAEAERALPPVFKLCTMLFA
jgi:hypothetical protein